MLRLRRKAMYKLIAISVVFLCASLIFGQVYSGRLWKQSNDLVVAKDTSGELALEFLKMTIPKIKMNFNEVAYLLK